MAEVFIVKGSITNVVSQELFDRTYKANGWKIDKSRQAPPKSVEQELKTETEIKNYATMKKKSEKVFDDNLIKKGD